MLYDRDITDMQVADYVSLWRRLAQLPDRRIDRGSPQRVERPRQVARPLRHERRGGDRVLLGLMPV